MGRLIYGTAWKGEETDRLVYCALKEGFRAISTAAQPKNYEEALVALGVRRAIDAGVVSRRDVSIQTTFTPASNQAIKKVVKTNRTGAHPGWPCRLTQRTSARGDCPYDPAASLTEQVRSSVASSLRNFTFTPNPGDTYLDAIILHTPYPSREHTEAVWRELSAYVPHPVHRLGISNVDSKELQHLLDFCRTSPAPVAMPSIVQNRFRGGSRGRDDDDAFDAAVRDICRNNGIEYQAFGVLREEVLLRDQQSVGTVAGLACVSREAALYALVMALQVDMAVLDGTSDSRTMGADINGVRSIGWYAEGPEWKRALESFKKGIHQL